MHCRRKVSISSIEIGVVLERGKEHLILHGHFFIVFKTETRIFGMFSSLPSRLPSAAFPASVKVRFQWCQRKYKCDFPRHFNRPPQQVDISAGKCRDSRRAWETTQVLLLRELPVRLDLEVNCGKCSLALENPDQLKLRVFLAGRFELLGREKDLSNRSGNVFLLGCEVLEWSGSAKVAVVINGGKPFENPVFLFWAVHPEDPSGRLVNAPFTAPWVVFSFIS